MLVTIFGGGGVFSLGLFLGFLVICFDYGSEKILICVKTYEFMGSISSPCSLDFTGHSFIDIAFKSIDTSLEKLSAETIPLYFQGSPIIPDQFGRRIKPHFPNIDIILILIFHNLQFLFLLRSKSRRSRNKGYIRILIILKIVILF